MILYVSEQGAEINLKRARIEVRKSKQLLDSVRMDSLEQLVLFGNIQITTQAMQALMRKQVDVCFLSLGGAFRGRLLGPTGFHAQLRHAQYSALSQPHLALDFAKACVLGKLKNQRTLLLRYQRRHQDDSIANALTRIRTLQEKLNLATDLNSLRGYEGSAAALYFGVFGQLLQSPDITFSRRIRRPPPDPVNILLSLGYTLLGQLIQGAIEQNRLDPYYGALHAVEYSRPSLALDLMEEWRPVIVDTAVLRAINRKQLQLQHFHPIHPQLDYEDANKYLEDTELLEADVWNASNPLVAPVPAASALHPQTAHSTSTSEPQENHAPNSSSNTPQFLLTPEGSKRWFAAYQMRLQESAFYPPDRQMLTYKQILLKQVQRFARSIQHNQPYESFLYQK